MIQVIITHDQAGNLHVQANPPTLSLYQVIGELAQATALVTAQLAAQASQPKIIPVNGDDVLRRLPKPNVG